MSFEKTLIKFIFSFVFECCGYFWHKQNHLTRTKRTKQEPLSITNPVRHANFCSNKLKAALRANTYIFRAKRNSQREERKKSTKRNDTKKQKNTKNEVNKCWKGKNNKSNVLFFLLWLNHSSFALRRTTIHFIFPRKTTFRWSAFPSTI